MKLIVSHLNNELEKGVGIPLLSALEVAVISIEKNRAELVDRMDFKEFCFISFENILILFMVDLF